MPVKFFRVVDGPVNIRTLPDTDAAKAGGQLQLGQQVEVVIESRTVNDGYIWWQHSLGWSVESSADGSKVFMREIIPDTDKAKGTAVVNMPSSASITLPTGTKIPQTILFQRHPVDLADTKWWQYFGNTRFAYNLCTDKVPVRQRMYFYCQGLHGGVDYGNSTPGVPIVAGINGVIEKVELGAKSYSPNCVRIKAGDFTVIYGHLGNVPALAVGQTVVPETPLGKIEGTQCHLHLEVRYKNTWIINPLLVMSTEMTNAIIAKFKKDFYSDANWTQWQTPFDQPVLKSSAPDKAVIIGPRAARG
jgi:hypothetical protein